MGIRQKILLILAVVLISTLGLNSTLLVAEQKKVNLEDIQQRGQALSQLLSKSLAYGVVGYDYHTIQLLIDEIIVSQNVSYVRVSNQYDKLMAMAGKENSPGTITFEQPIYLDKTVIGHLSMGIDTRHLDESLQARFYTVLQREGLIILLVIIGEFFALSYFIIRPLCRITMTIQDSAKDSYSNINAVPVQSNDEFGQLSLEFNRMSRKISETTHQLQIKAEAADQQLLRTNKRLLEQSAELRNTNQELHKLSITDALTGVYNRRYFDDQLSNEAEAAHRYDEPCSLLLVDLDHFKAVNDKYGHYAGDIVLTNVAHTLQEILRKADLLCRFGGEEFAIICKHTNQESAIRLAEKLRHSIETLDNIVDESHIHVTISIGISTIPNDETTYGKDNFYLCADKALYTSKEKGRNQVTHCNSLTSEVVPFVPKQQK